MLGTLSDFNYQENATKEFTFVDKCILNELANIENKYHEYFDTYQFANALSLIVNFLQIDLSSFYLDMAKDILYCDAINSLRRRQIQTVIYQVVDVLSKLLAPIIPHTAEEIYDNFVGKEKESIFLTKYNFKVKEYDDNLAKLYVEFMELRNGVLKALEEKRAEKLIGKSIDATLYLKIKESNIKQIIDNMDADTLQHIFIVSKVILTSDETNLLDYGKAYLNVTKNEGIMCERCWNIIDKKDICADNLCQRCYNVVKENK